MDIYYITLLLRVGVAPVYTDEETCSFVREQKQQQYGDLRHALQIMGRIEYPSSQRRQLSAGQLTYTPSSSQDSHLPPPSHHTLSPQLQMISSRQIPSSLRTQSTRNAFGECPKAKHRCSVPLTMSGSASSSRSLLPEHMVLMYLLENNRLLSSSVNQMKLEAQVLL